MNKPYFSLLIFSLFFYCSYAQAPTGLDATNTRTTVHLQWDDYTAFEPVGYNIYRSTVSGNYGAPARRAGAYDNYTDYGLSPSTTYFYKISAFGASGNESPLSAEITVVTDDNFYTKIASLDVLVPIYTGGMTANAPAEIMSDLEHAREFYFRNSLGKLNLNFHFWVLSGYPPPNSNGQADFGTIEADLHDRGILDNQYDAVYIEAMNLYGFFGGAWWLGQTAGSMGYDWTHWDADDKFTQGNSGLFIHEFGHALDFVMANGSGFPEMLYNHFGDNYPLPPEIGTLDIGTGQDGMAYVLRLFEHHLDYAAPWDGYFEVVDHDHDGLADNDLRVPMDEVRFGSSPFTDDSDLDGLTDAEEYYAGTFSSADPNNPDTDDDGVTDGQDVYPVSNFNPTNLKTTGTVTIDGAMSPGEGWQPMASGPFFTAIPGATLNTFTTWDDGNFYFTFQSNQQLKYFLQMDASGENGVWETDIRFPGGDYSSVNPNAWGDSYFETGELVIRSDGSQVYLKENPIPGSQVVTTFSGGVYTTEVKLPHNMGPGFGHTWSPPGSPVVTVQTYGEGDIVGIHLVGIPLSEANGNAATDWFGYYTNKSIVVLNDFQHFYDMELTAGQVAGYCPSTSNFPWEEWIAKVKIGNIDNASGKSPYSDFTSISTNLIVGSTPIQLTTGFSYFTWDEYWRVWIDLNQDGDFEDAGELVLETMKPAPPAGTATSQLNGNIFIPTSAMTGPTRMRISMKRGAYPTPCETLPFGEVEDYAINIGQQPNLYFPYFELIPTNAFNCFVNSGVPFEASAAGGVVNSGTAAAGPFKVYCFLSTDELYGPNDFLWKTFNYPGLAPNDFAGISLSGEIVPASLPLGKYFIILRLDPENTVAETNESDNQLVTGSFNIGAPDFAVNTAAGVPTAAVAGSSLTLNVTAVNLSAFPLPQLTGSLEATVYLSDDQEISTGTDLEIGSATIPFTQFSNAPLYLDGQATVNVPAVIPGGTPAGNYFIYVRLSAGCERSGQNNASAFFPIQINTGGPVTYCTSYSNFPWEDWIAKVELSNLNNASGKSAYSNFTNLAANVNAGQSYPIKLTTGYSYFTWDEYWRVWIDFNKDGVFSTPDEVVQQQILTAPAPGTPTATVTATVNIPSWAPTGITRMRVSMKRGAFASACEILPFGEVEDYTVNIGSGSGCSPDVTPPVIAGCPANISLTATGPTQATWTPPTATDNCTTASLTSTHQPGAIFPLGTTTVTYTAKDAANNTATCTFTVTVTQISPNLPDLVLTNLQSPAAGAVGAIVNFTFKLNNIGAATASGNYVIGSYLSTDNVWSQNDVLAGTVPTGNTPVNFNTTVPASITVPAGTAPGSYFLIVVADKDNVIQESNENNNIISAAFQVTGGGAVTYCNSSSNFPWEDWIAKVELGNLSNTSGKTPYSDFTALTANLQSGASPTVKLTTGYSYFTWDEYWRIWIDFNHDGDFTDQGEMVLSQILTAPPAGTISKTLTSVITIPGTVQNGLTRMRISMKRGAYPTPCETLPFGEVEDYTVNISGGGTSCSITATTGTVACQDNGTPNNPNDDTFTFEILVTGTGVSQNWQMTWPGGSTSGIFTVVKTIGPLPISAFTGGLNFTIFDNANQTCSTTGSVMPPPPCSSTPPANYCASTSDFPWEDWITRVQVNTLDNSSGKSPYSNFTALNTTLEKGVDYEMTLTTGFSYFTWNEYWKVWIDFNHDNIFQDPDEAVFSKILNAPPNGTATASVTGTFKLPVAALNGPTRMRVTMKRGSFASPCETLAFGEIEDYTVNIVDMFAGPGAGDRAANLSFEAVMEKTWVNLYAGWHFTAAVSQVEIEKSPDGVAYELLETVPGKSAPGASQAVRTLDGQPNDGFNFYRMLILFENGEMVYSPVRVVTFDLPADLTLFPNPAQTELFVQLTEPPEGKMTWFISDAHGRVVWTQVVEPGAAFPYRVDVQGLEEGMYFLYARRPGRRAVGRIFTIVR